MLPTATPLVHANMFHHFSLGVLRLSTSWHTTPAGVTAHRCKQNARNAAVFMYVYVHTSNEIAGGIIWVAPLLRLQHNPTQRIIKWTQYCTKHLASLFSSMCLQRRSNFALYIFFPLLYWLTCLSTGNAIALCAKTYTMFHYSSAHWIAYWQLLRAYQYVTVV